VNPAPAALIPPAARTDVLTGDAKAARRRVRLFWGLQIGGWLLLIPIVAAIMMIGLPNPHTAAVAGALRQVIGFVVTLGLWRLYRRWPSSDFKLVRHALWIFGFCLLATAVDELVFRSLGELFALAPLPVLAQRGSVVMRALLYVAWSALYFTIRRELDSRDHELRLARAEAAARENELRVLRAQVNPHFLFNALHTIVAEAEDHPETVGEIAHAVADYLRYSLRHGAHHAPLGEELNAMGNYLNVERAHLGRDRLDWQIEATDEARMTPAPTALVQPLVENAIKYGLRTSPRPLRLRVDARVQDGELRVAVENSGNWLQRRPGETARDSTGLGLNNLRRRLALLCGENARLEVLTPEGAVRIEVRVPAPPPTSGTTPPF
jgi:Histidine kinase